MLYSAQIWGIGLNSKLLVKSSLAPLEKLQNQYLWKITGAYKRTLRAILKREAAVLPIDIYIEATAIQRASTVQDHLVEKEICQILDCI